MKKGLSAKRIRKKINEENDNEQSAEVHTYISHVHTGIFIS